jgi:23S rRNA (uracil1939-C5)-methyltransferase
MSLQPEKSYTVKITGLSHEGAGVGRLKGTAVFVAGALTGEEVDVKLQKVKKKYALGKLIKINTPSAHRVKPLCQLYDTCGSCQLQHLDYSKQLEAKTERVRETLERIGKLKGFNLKPTIGMENPWHYRNKAQLHVGWYEGKIRLGYYRPGSWELVPISDCNLLPKVFSQIIGAMEELLKDTSIKPYDRKRKQGYLKHVILKSSHATGEVMVIIVTNGELDEELTTIASRLMEAYPSIVSMIHSVNTVDGTNIGRSFKVIKGKKTIQEKLGNLTFSISPPAFFQVNVEQMKVLYDQVVTYANLQGTETVLDLYCGTGTISLFLAEHARYVHGIEEVAMAIEDATTNARLNGVANVKFHAGKVETVLPAMLEAGAKADVIVLDPPRQGCDRNVLEAATAMNPSHMVYVSCDPATLARDLRILQEMGYKTREVQPVDMFPQTSHVECVVLITRNM